MQGLGKVLFYFMARPKKEDFNRADKRYEVKITVGHDTSGKCIQKSFYSTKSKDDAKKKGLEYLNALEHGRLEETIRNQNFTVWSRRWLEVYVKGRVKDSTYYSNYELPLQRHLIPYFGKMNLSDIRPSHVIEFINDKIESYPTETVRKFIVCLSQIMEAAVDENFCARNPVTKKCTVPKKKKETSKRAYTPEQYELVLQYAKSVKAVDIIILLKTGISRSELLGLRWNDVDFQNKILHICQGVTEFKNISTGKYNKIADEPKNKYRIRDIPIDDELINALNNLPRQIKTGGNKKLGIPPTSIEPKYIIHDSKGNMTNPKNWSRYRYNNFMTQMNAHYLEEGKDVPILNAHELRHTRLTLWANAGVSIYMIAKLAGHVDLKMLAKVYGHPDIEAMRKAIVTQKPDI